MYLWPLHIYSTLPISVPLLILLVACGFGSSSSTFAASFLFVCLFTFISMYVVCQTCLGLPSCCYLLEGSFEFFSSLAAAFEFSYLCATISSPLAFCSFGRVSLTVGSSSYILPSCLAAASPMVFSQWHANYAVRGPLATSHAALLRIVVGSLRCAVAVFLAWSSFSCLHDFVSIL